MSEANGNAVVSGETGSDVASAAGANRLPASSRKKPVAVKGTAAAFYAAMQKVTAKKKSLVLTADVDDGKVTLTVKSFPTLDKSAVETAAFAGADVSFKVKGGIEGKDAMAKGSYEGEFGTKIAGEFFLMDTSEKE